MVLFSIGLVLAIITEMCSTRIGYWAYSEEIQKPPLVDVGIHHYYNLRFSCGELF